MIGYNYPNGFMKRLSICEMVMNDDRRWTDANRYQ